jgi:hypothetical protein
MVEIWAEEGRPVGLAEREARRCRLAPGRPARYGSKPGWVACWAKTRRKGCWARPAEAGPVQNGGRSRLGWIEERRKAN